MGHPEIMLMNNIFNTFDSILKEETSPSTSVKLNNVKPENVQVSINPKKGKITINAMSEEDFTTRYGGKRKITKIIEQTLSVPEYIVTEYLFDKIGTDFSENCLVFKWPKIPLGVSIPIVMDDQEESVTVDVTDEIDVEN